MAYQRSAAISALLILSYFCLSAIGQSSAAPSADTSFESRIVESIPRYQPEQSVSGVIRLWGHGNVKLPWLKQLVGFWEEGFRRYQPGVRIQSELHGTSSAIPALFTGVGDIAILGE